ncbi:AbiV family abortive infection protein [Bacteroidota bacterium]
MAIDNEKLTNMSKEQLFKGGQLCVESAENHYTIAKIAASKGLYGIGYSHLVLGAEEALKSWIVYAAVIGANLEKVDVKAVFSDHEYKHNELKKFLKYISILWPMMKFLKKVAKKHGLNTNMGDIFLELVTELPDSRIWEEHSGKVLKWLQKADSKKNDGFYVGYGRGWKTPNTIIAEQFAESEKLVAPLFEVGSLTKTFTLEEWLSVRDLLGTNKPNI